ncbi:MAG TPA: hypothetical protein VLC09_14240, partial [Polyangiaceae bacterium]|nr:hypothetical protein [Polyangiaceae bacterium]
MAPRLRLGSIHGMRHLGSLAGLWIGATACSSDDLDGNLDGADADGAADEASDDGPASGGSSGPGSGTGGASSTGGGASGGAGTGGEGAGTGGASVGGSGGSATGGGGTGGAGTGGAAACTTASPPSQFATTLDATWDEMTGGFQGKTGARPASASVLQFENTLLDQIFENDGSLNY